jgi:hypothetical protein
MKISAKMAWRRLKIKTETLGGAKPNRRKSENNGENRLAWQANMANNGEIIGKEMCVISEEMASGVINGESRASWRKHQGSAGKLTKKKTTETWRKIWRRKSGENTERNTGSSAKAAAKK